MSDDPKNYYLKAVTDARSALADRLVEFIAELQFALPKTTEPFVLRAVFSTWSSFEQRAMSAGGLLPAAAVLPDRSVYEASSLTPRLDEKTWDGGDASLVDQNGNQRFPHGDGSGRGFVVVPFAELMTPFLLVVRGKTKAQRKAIVKGIEESLLEDGTGLDRTRLNPTVSIPDIRDNPIRYGRVLKVPRYYDRPATYSLQATQLLDSESTAAENRWLAQLEITGHIQVCVLRAVRAMKTRVEFVVDGTPAPR